MNNLRYRAWDYLNNQMVYSDKEDNFYVNRKGVLFMYKFPKSEEYYKTYEVMEYTKTDDREGTAIYDLDVIEIMSTVSHIPKGHKAVVYYSEVHNRFAAVLFDDYGAKSTAFRPHFFITPANAKKIKVVNNLFEMGMNKTTNKSYS